MKRLIASVFLAGFLTACGGVRDDPAAAVSQEGQSQSQGLSETAPIGSIAEDFVKLALGVGQYDPDYVDAYYGPEAWADAVASDAKSLEQLIQDAESLLERLAAVNAATPSARGAKLKKVLVAARTRLQMAAGETFSFDDEARLLYDARAPQYDIQTFDKALADIDALLPGEGSLEERMNAFRAQFAIPAENLSAVFDAAIAECRKRTLAHYDLPENERFTLEFVADKPWSGYNWYRGDYESLIQINTDFPISIDRAIDLGCHEGYPGHHTQGVINERDLLGKNEWIEYSVFPLFSPAAFIAEGTANYGIELAFPGDEKLAFERDVLFPLAGIDPALAEQLDRLNEAWRPLSHLSNHVGRLYLDESIDREAALGMLMKYGMRSRERAEQSVAFIEKYRAYVINYNLGLEIVDEFMKRRTAAGEDPWSAFQTLLSEPLSPSDLQADE
ncbi:MAG: hypothetical protein AAGC77_04735 [Pseudomonadota bacterium]